MRPLHSPKLSLLSSLIMHPQNPRSNYTRIDDGKKHVSFSLLSLTLGKLGAMGNGNAPPTHASVAHYARNTGGLSSQTLEITAAVRNKTHRQRVMARCWMFFEGAAYESLRARCISYAVRFLDVD